MLSASGQNERAERRVLRSIRNGQTSILRLPKGVLFELAADRLIAKGEAVLDEPSLLITDAGRVRLARLEAQ